MDNGYLFRNYDIQIYEQKCDTICMGGSNETEQKPLNEMVLLISSVITNDTQALVSQFHQAGPYYHMGKSGLFSRPHDYGSTPNFCSFICPYPKSGFKKIISAFIIQVYI